jgi:hypothetical protein
MLCFFLLRRFSGFPLEATICPNFTRAVHFRRQQFALIALGQ